MANHSLFKSFKHDGSKQLYSNNQVGYWRSVSPLIVSQCELKALWNNSPCNFPDVLVSIGSGTTDWKSPKSIDRGTLKFSWKKLSENISLLGEPISAPPLDEICRRDWKEFLGGLPMEAPTNNYIRLNLRIPHALPAVDDLEGMEKLEMIVRTSIDRDEIRGLATRLIATFFYFEHDNKEDITTNGIRLQGLTLKLALNYKTVSNISNKGEILCRLPDGSPEIYEIGRLFKDGRFKNAEFVFREHGCASQSIEVSSIVIQDMLVELRFQMPKIRLGISEPFAKVSAVLRSENGEEYSISGFPRVLLGKKEEARGKSHPLQIIAPNF